MPDVIFFDADPGVTLDAFIDGAARSAAAAYQDDRFEQLGMIQTQQDRHTRADADAAENRFAHAFVAADAQHVFGHFFEGERRFRFIRAAVTADIDGDHSEV